MVKQIVLQDSLDDDSSAGNGVLEGTNSEPPRDDFRGRDVAEDDMTQIETEYFDDFPQGYNSRKGGRRTPYMNSVRDNMPDGDGNLAFPPEAPAQCRPGSRGQPLLSSGGDCHSPREERYDITLDGCNMPISITCIR